MMRIFAFWVPVVTLLQSLDTAVDAGEFFKIVFNLIEEFLSGSSSCYE